MRIHRFLQFSLRWALVGLTACGVWLGIWTNGARREREGTRVAKALEAEIWYEHEGAPDFMMVWGDNCQLIFQGHAPVSPSVPGPAWLRRAIGEEYFLRVVALNLSGRAVSDSDIQAIAGLANLSRLDRY